MIPAVALIGKKEETVVKDEKDEALRGGMIKAGGEIARLGAPAEIALDVVEDEIKTDARRGPKELLPWGQWKSRHRRRRRAGNLREGPVQPGKRGRP